MNSDSISHRSCKKIMKEIHSCCTKMCSFSKCLRMHAAGLKSFVFKWDTSFSKTTLLEREQGCIHILGVGLWCNKVGLTTLDDSTWYTAFTSNGRTYVGIQITCVNPLFWFGKRRILWHNHDSTCYTAYSSNARGYVGIQTNLRTSSVLIGKRRTPW